MLKRALRTLMLLALAAALAALPVLPLRAQPEAELLVFAAASLTEVMEEIGVLYEAETGTGVVYSFAGSMTLARQIEASAGPDIFISADPESMDYLAEQGLIAVATRRDILANELVLVAPSASPRRIEIAPGFALTQALKDALEGGRLAVANTASVPAGRYARAALETLGVWEGVEASLAESEDVRAALALVARGEAPLGIVYATDAAIEPRVAVAGRFPAASHPPIRYPAALTLEARGEAESFLEFLRGDAARRVLEAAGFIVLTPQ